MNISTSENEEIFFYTIDVATENWIVRIGVP